MKFYDNVNFEISAEIRPGICEGTVISRKYPGNLQRMISKWTRGGDKINEDKRVNNQLEIIADEFLSVNFTNIRSINWMGQEWAVNTVTYAPPMLTLEIGELYNGT